MSDRDFVGVARFTSQKPKNQPPDCCITLPLNRQVKPFLDYFHWGVAVYGIATVTIALDKRYRFVKLILDVSDQTLDYIFQGYDSYHYSVFIIGDGQVDMFFAHIKKYFVGFLNLRNTDDFAQDICLNNFFIFLRCFYQSIYIFDMNKSNNIIKTIFIDWKTAIPLIQITADLTYGQVAVYGKYGRSGCHHPSYLFVGKLKRILEDTNFFLIYYSALSDLIEDDLQFFFCID